MCKWIVDADQIQMSDYDSSLLYQNDLVTSFVYIGIRDAGRRKGSAVSPSSTPDGDHPASV